MYELKMGFTESGLPYAAGVGVVAGKHPVEADLIERRLRRIEIALGIDASPESTAELEGALSSFSSTIRPDVA